MTQGKFADYFHIPVRTLQKWENEERQPREYVVYMMETILKQDGVKKEDK